MAAKGSDPKIAVESFASLAMVDPAHAKSIIAPRSLAKSGFAKRSEALAVLLNDLAMCASGKKITRAEALFRRHCDPAKRNWV